MRLPHAAILLSLSFGVSLGTSGGESTNENEVKGTKGGYRQLDLGGLLGNIIQAAAPAVINAVVPALFGGLRTLDVQEQVGHKLFPIHFCRFHNITA